MPPNTSFLLDVILGGVDFNLAGNGGKECVEFLSPTQRYIESILSVLFSMYIIYLSYFKMKVPAVGNEAYKREQSYWGKRVMLVIMCLTFGMELGFKFATRQMIWLLNPCHVASMIQIYLLAATPSRHVTAIFRLHLHMLTGAPMALIFPVINTRLLPFEAEVYYIQHILMLIIPFYLMRMGGVYIPEKLSDFSWSTMSLGILYIYHFFPMQIVALSTEVNLNNMLCPAISDPFHGPYYRICAISHQILLISLLGRLYIWIAKLMNICPNHDYSIEENWLLKTKSNGKVHICSETVGNGTNGHAKVN